MLTNLLIFFLILLFLFLISQRITSSLYSLFYILSGKEKLSIVILCLFLLPGTIIHEFSHLVTAVIFRVPTGKLSIWPVRENGRIIKTGQLELVQSDPFRRTLIGLSPLLSGLTLIYLIGKYFSSNLFRLTTYQPQFITITLLTVTCYFIFTISITMFSSKKDLESLLIAGPILILLFLSMRYVGIRIFLEEKLLWAVIHHLADLNFYLLIACVLDYFLFILLTISLSVAKKLFKRA